MRRPNPRRAITPTVMEEMVAIPMLESLTDLAKFRSSTTVAGTMLADDPPRMLIRLSKNLSSSLETAPKNSSSLRTGSGGALESSSSSSSTWFPLSPAI